MFQAQYVILGYLGYRTYAMSRLPDAEQTDSKNGIVNLETIQSIGSAVQIESSQETKNESADEAAIMFEMEKADSSICSNPEDEKSIEIANPVDESQQKEEETSSIVVQNSPKIEIRLESTKIINDPIENLKTPQSSDAENRLMNFDQEEIERTHRQDLSQFSDELWSPNRKTRAKRNK